MGNQQIQSKIYKYLKESKYSDASAIYHAMDDISHFMNWIKDNSVYKDDKKWLKELNKAHDILRNAESYFREKYLEFRQ